MMIQKKLNRSGHEESQQIIQIENAGTIANMEAMPRGLNCRWLECTTYENENGTTLIAMKWRRKLPRAIEPWHRIVDFGK